MTEFVAQLPSPESQITYAPIQSIEHWQENPNPVIKEAHLALQRQMKKTPTEITPDKSPEKARDGVYLSPEFHGSRIFRIGQRRNQDDLLTRGSSAHNVSFGMAEIRTSNGQLMVCGIAAKQFTEARNALKEAYSNTVVLQRGFRTVHPIAVIVNNNKGYLLSVARKDTKSLDTEPWHQFLTGEVDTRRYFEELLFRVSILLANLHTAGIRHGDAQMKNFWVTPRGNVEAIDWEASMIHPEYPSGDQFLTAASNDLVTLFKSLRGKDIQEPPNGILTGTKEAIWHQFQELVLQHYIKQAFTNLIEQDNLSDEQILEILAAEGSGSQNLINTLREITHFN